MMSDKSDKSDISGKDVSLPASRAFVIQLRASSGAAAVGHGGRVEHLSSGQALHFADEDELWAFIDGVLAIEGLATGD